MKWRYPLSDIDLGRAEEGAVLKILKGRWLSTGPVTERFETSFSRFLGGGRAIAVSNGTAALHLALACLDLRRGDEVILPSLTFVATANAVLYEGATPVFADITGPDNFNISPEEIEKKVTPKTKAVIVMHYGGYPCDMESILRTAREKRLAVIEDAAHAPGSLYRQTPCGMIGDMGCFSFFSNKNLVTGEGGMVVTNNEDWASRIRTMRSHAMTALSWDKYRGHLASYDIKELGFNYRMTEIEAALGLVQLGKLQRNRKRRENLARLYREELQGVEGISIPFTRLSGTFSHHLFPVLASCDPGDRSPRRRDTWMEELKKLRVQTSVHYPPVHLFSLYRKRFGTKQGMLPQTEQVSRREVTLPLHPLMSEQDVKWIAGKMKKIAERIGR
jgi:dTDP-4-amino-4,6-dideoxygalactose transaminase